MNEFEIADLECPRFVNAKKCRGNLTAKILHRQANEILQGFLLCQKCRARYPIIQGIPVLYTEPGTGFKEYLKKQSKKIVTYIGGTDVLHRTLYKYLRCYLRGDAPRIVTKIQEKNSLWLQSYLLRHYGNVCKVKNRSVFKPFLKLYRKRNFYKIVDPWLAALDLNTKKCFDAGCSVGRITLSLAQRCRFAYGLDKDYRSLITASGIIKHIPDKIDGFRITTNGALGEINRISINRLANLDFIAGSVHGLPFKNNIFDVIIASGVDFRPLKILLQELYRTLKINGEILLTINPGTGEVFCPRDVPRTPEAVKKALKNIVFYREIKNVPYIVRFSESYWVILFYHVLIGRKVR